MGEKVKLTRGTHRRTGDDGTPTVFEAGDVFEATDLELESFGDKLEPVEQDGDEWVPTRSTPGVDEPEAGEYRLLRGNHRTTDEDGNAVVVEEGETTHLTEQEAEAFGDRFEKVAADDAGDDDRDDAEEDDALDGDDVDGATDDVEEAVDETEDAEDAADETAEGESSDDKTEGETGETGIPDELPDDYRELQTLAKEHGVKGDQSKADIVAALEDKRDGGE